MKIVVHFDGVVTEAMQELFNKFVIENTNENTEVFGLGGGIKNPKK